MWKDNQCFSVEFFLSCAFLVHEHDTLDTITIGLGEETECLWDDICGTDGDIDRRDEITMLIYEDEGYFCTRLLPIKTDIVTQRELAIEFEEDEVLDHSLLARTMVVADTECDSEEREVREVYLHMTEELCIWRVSERADRTDESMLHEKFCIFAHLSPRDTHHLGDTIFLEEITDSESKCADIFDEVIFLFIEQFLDHNCYFIIPDIFQVLWIGYIFSVLTEMDIVITERVQLSDISSSTEDRTDLYWDSISLAIFTEGYPWYLEITDISLCSYSLCGVYHFRIEHF
jgi:hypothetical protein